MEKGTRKYKQYIQSPFNYTGGKYRLLSQIIPLFPMEIETFVDLFCGGGNVGINVESERLIFNDIEPELISIFRIFYKNDSKEIIEKIMEVIESYNLSLVSENGYAFYGCDSSVGLSSYNRESFLKLRFDTNHSEEKDEMYFLKLFVLIIYSFNNQIRFNKEGLFNLPVGKRDFNIKMQQKLEWFIKRLQVKRCEMEMYDFRSFNYSELTKKDFVYVDPPYLIGRATYNENGGWTEKDEIELYRELDRLHDRGIRFALSNVLSSKGKENVILKKWLEERNDYVCHHLKYNYNSNYHTLKTDTPTDEVLIVNYRKENT